MNARRVIVRASVLLVLGAAINLVIAWCLALRGGYGFDGELPEVLKDQTRWRGALGPDWPDRAEDGYEVNFTGFRFVLQQQRGPDPENGWENPTLYQLYSWQVGWPCRSMTWELRGTLPDARGTIFGCVCDDISLWRRGVEAPARLVVWEAPYSGYLRRAPIRALLAGFAANTLLFAIVVSAFMLLPGVVRSFARSRRGRCVTCAYDVRSLAICPECGRRSMEQRSAE